MIKPITIPAGERVTVSVVGRFFRCRESSAAFELKAGSDTYTLEGGDEFLVRDTDRPFKALTFINLSATDDLLVDFFAGSNPVRNAYVKLPRTEVFGRDVDISGNGASQIFAGVVDGKRRKQFTVTIRAGIGAGRVHVRNADTGELLAIITSSSIGVGFAIETDANIMLKNDQLGAGITSAAGNIAVCETFYK